LPEQLVGSESSYVVQKGDSLIGIGAGFGIAAGVLAAHTNLSPSSLLKLGHSSE
jgi:hypothetical protein